MSTIKGRARASCRRPFGPWMQRRFPRETHPSSNERWLPECYVNNRYSVQQSVYRCSLGEILHLWIRRHDGKVIRAWADLQRIKNELVGPDRVAVEVFPPQSELVDEANMAHLWVYPPDTVLPFTLRPKSEASD